MAKMKIIIMTILISLSLQSCKLWPYRSDFDCPIPDGYKCKSLYEVNNLVDLGAFEEKPLKQIKKTDEKRCECKKLN